MAEENLYQKALDRLTRLLEDAGHRGVSEPDTAALATAAADARPSVRMITVLAVEAEGIVFLANRASGKGLQLAQNPRAALCFYWPVLKEQVIVEGQVEIQADAVSDASWQRRLREGQMVAWAAEQSQPSAEKGDVQKRLSSFRAEADFDRIARHPDWQAYRIIPDRIEFWPTGWQRARERVRFCGGEHGEWICELLNP